MTLVYEPNKNTILDESSDLYKLIFSSDLIGTSGSTYSIRQITNPRTNRATKGTYEIFTQKSLDFGVEELDFRLRCDILDKLRLKIKDLTDQNVKKVSEQILILLERYINPFSNMNLPLFYSFIRDDGSFLIEWNFEHYKLGISIETNISDSSWNFVSDEKFGYFSASGETQNIKFNSILEWLVPFVIMMSKS